MESKRALAFSIVEFLQSCVADKTVEGDDAESLNVAAQCISEAFGVDVENEGHKKQHSIKPATLSSIFEVFLKTQKKRQEELKKPVTDEQTKSADALKNEGNQKLAQKQYDEAIKLYTEAIKLNPTSAVYYANRAAAYSQSNQHELAIDDCKAAIEVDSNYSKAYSRMGLALFSLKRYQEAVDSYKKALELDPSNVTSQQSLAAAEQKLQAQNESETSSPVNETSRGMGGAGPDLGSLLNNPALMQMASQMMQNPEVANMARNMFGGAGNAGGSAGGNQGGGGNPLAGLMNNPQLMNMAQQMMSDPQMANMMRGFTNRDQPQ